MKCDHNYIFYIYLSQYILITIIYFLSLLPTFNNSFSFYSSPTSTFSIDNLHFLSFSSNTLLLWNLLVFSIVYQSHESLHISIYFPIFHFYLFYISSIPLSICLSNHLTDYLINTLIYNVSSISSIILLIINHNSILFLYIPHMSNESHSILHDLDWMSSLLEIEN